MITSRFGLRAGAAFAIAAAPAVANTVRRVSIVIVVNSMRPDELTRRSLLLGAGPLLAAAPSRFLGITMMPEYIQNEGIDGTLRNLIERAKVTAVTISPYVMEPSNDADASREPPIDAGAGSVRLLDRPLWGKRELRVRTAPSYTHRFSRFRPLRYQPMEPTELTQKQGRIVSDFILEAQRRKLKVYFQVQAAIPPAYRVQFGGPVDDDQPRLPDGSYLKRRVSNNGSLASEHILQYLETFLGDLVETYPEIDGIRLDWPEYPPYFYEETFFDFSRHAESFARARGINWDALKTESLAAMKAPGLKLVPQLNQLKAQMAEALIARARKAIPGKELIPNAFPPPFNEVSGFDYARIGKHCDGVSVKLYTMHWPMMLRFWSENRNPAFFRDAQKWMNIGAFRSLNDCRYPEPDEPHPVSAAAQEAKIKAAQKAAGATPVYALAHGYGPVADFRKRLALAWRASAGRVWINRYGYLSDAKLAAVGEVCS